MEPLEWAALAAAIAGAGMQYKASTDAQQRQQQAIQQGLQAQRDLQMQAENKALTTAQTFNPADRIANQAKIADTITNNLITPVEASQATRAAGAGDTGDVSSDYTTAKAKADLNTLGTAQTLAKLLGQTSSANRLRQGEAINLMNTGQAIDQLNSFSNGQKNATAINVQQAGLLNPGQVFGGQLLTSLGTAGLMAGGGANPVTDGAVSTANNAADPIASLNDTMGWTGASGKGALGIFGNLGNAYKNWMSSNYATN